jgi:regulatory protein
MAVRGGFGGKRRGRRPPADPASAEAARGRAIGLLARRDYPRRALKARLTESGFEDGAAEHAVTALEDERLVNDARYVEAAVASRAGRGQGPLRIALELRRQGVAAALIDAAVAIRSPDWQVQATALRLRRFGRGAPADAAERARQARFLLQRGFTGEQVRAALGAAAADLELEDVDPASLTDEDAGGDA